MQPLSSIMDPEAGPPLQPFPGRLPSGKTMRKNVISTFEKILLQGRDPLQEEIVIDIDGSKPHHQEQYSPCLTRTRAAGGGHWLSWLQRRMTTCEVCALQGVDYDRLPQGMASDRQIRELAGNSIPIPLLARIMHAALKAGGLV